MSAKGFDVVVRNNLTGGFIVSREVFTQSMQKHGGSIVNMAADYAQRLPQHGAHRRRARRHGQPHHDACLRMGHAGVRVNAVSPGWIASSGMDTYQGEFKEQIPKLKGYCPLGRLGTESEVSAAVCFLLSDARPTSPAPRSASTAACRSATARWTCRHRRSQPFNGFHLAKTPKVLGG
jgi:citronellol/citronellal dehydrogenase